MVKRFSLEHLPLVRYQQNVRRRNDADRTGNRKVTQLTGITDSKLELLVVWRAHRNYCETCWKFLSMKGERAVSEIHPQKGGQKGVPKGGTKVEKGTTTTTMEERQASKVYYTSSDRVFLLWKKGHVKRDCRVNLEEAKCSMVAITAPPEWTKTIQINGKEMAALLDTECTVRWATCWLMQASLGHFPWC